MLKLIKGLEIIEERVEDGIVWSTPEEQPNAFRSLAVDEKGNFHIIDSNAEFDMVTNECPCKKPHYEEE